MLAVSCCVSIFTPDFCFAQQADKASFELNAQRFSGEGRSEHSDRRLARPGTAVEETGSNPVNAAEVNTTRINGGSSLVDPMLFKESGAGGEQRPPIDLHANRIEVGTGMGNVPIVDISNPVQVLGNYQLELIVDRSLSMQTRDCPWGLSRWAWCGMQAQELSRAISPFAPDGITITPFESRFKVYPRSSPAAIADLFAHPQFRFGTRLAEPLKNRLNSFFAERMPNQKPLLIAVITDGVPFPQPEPDMVIKELIKASKLMNNPGEVVVVFFQIGADDRFGHDYLQFLDRGLVRRGAQFHYVHSIPFEQLMATGLSRALVDTVRSVQASR